jgi:uncharacterized repeat protein (TIGR03803 family)
VHYLFAQEGNIDMNSCRFVVARSCLFSIALLALLGIQAPGQTETILHSFGKGTDGQTPLAGLVRDTKGNLYGTTANGGTYTQGTVFKVTPSGTETILYSFDPNAGTEETYAGLVRDTKGNLYGTTIGLGCGTVFELTTSGTETTLYTFLLDGTDACFPTAGVVRDTKGNLYGTTGFGGVNSCGNENCGTVFELTPSGKEMILHNFDNNGTDGFYPLAGLVRDTKGNLYGTTSQGGRHDRGTVFELTPSGTETILHSFNKNGTDGYFASAGLALDTKGNLYGTTQLGGAHDEGTVFKLTPTGKETILHSFGEGKDGTTPLAGLIFDTEGNLYGTTATGGTYNLGTVFKLTPSGTETILHSFGENPTTDGYYPGAALVLDTEGNLYGTTELGGKYVYGTVFKVTP